MINADKKKITMVMQIQHTPGASAGHHVGGEARQKRGDASQARQRSASRLAPGFKHIPV